VDPASWATLLVAIACALFAAIAAFEKRLRALLFSIGLVLIGTAVGLAASTDFRHNTATPPAVSVSSVAATRPTEPSVTKTQTVAPSPETVTSSPVTATSQPAAEPASSSTVPSPVASPNQAATEERKLAIGCGVYLVIIVALAAVALIFL
jgi:hypothetical protein